MENEYVHYRLLRAGREKIEENVNMYVEDLPFNCYVHSNRPVTERRESSRWDDSLRSPRLELSEVSRHSMLRFRIC